MTTLPHPILLSVVLLTLHCLVSQSEGLICLSSHCPNGVTLCNDYCTSDSNACHIIAHSIDPTDLKPIEFGCTHTSSNCTSECDLQSTSFGNVHYCCCSGDHCNQVAGYTDHLLPLLGIHSNSSPGQPPPPSNDTVCEDFSCDQDKGKCYHEYKVCEEKNGVKPYCIANYLVNEDNKLELKKMGCEHEPLPDCYNNTECHIDNQLSAGENEFYFCCCGSSRCNENVTFTHPTEHSDYGLKECEALDCQQSCLIVNNKPICVCRDGYVLSGTQCIDIDECMNNNTGCHKDLEVCVNTEGGYRCDCIPGHTYSEDRKECINDDGITCESYNCLNNNTNCTVELEHCAFTAPPSLIDREYHFCSTVYELIDNELVRRFSSCLPGPHLCGSNPGTCSLELVHSSNRQYACCCYGDLCNAHENLDFSLVSPNSSELLVSSSVQVENPITSVTGPTQATVIVTATNTNVSPNSSMSDVIATPLAIGFAVVLFVVAFLIVLVIVAICILKFYYIKSKHLPTTVGDIEASSQETHVPLPVLDTVIGQGRFAKVYCTTINEQQVAVKVFNNTLQAKESWNREKEIYSTEELQHPNILRFLDADRRMDEGVDTFWLIFEYQPNGSLYDYLQHYTISLKEFSSLAYSASCGLAHLHSEMSVHNNTVGKKPSIAHRDLKSKNILVKSDMTSCISDFGLAIKLNPGEHQTDAQGQVGTSRYMAPEVLEGAISFHQESFLRIDVYAFGLVLWEMASRCDIAGNPVGEYRPPFKDIVSPNPSIGEMRSVVAEQQKRPEIPRGFQNKPGYEPVVESITESWDPDAEARPSAHLIENRLQTFFELVNSKHSDLKESGYLSHHAIPSSINLTSTDSPLPLTPSSSPGVTLSPSDTKTLQFNCSSSTLTHNDLYYRSSYHSSIIDSGHTSDFVQDSNTSDNNQPYLLNASDSKMNGTTPGSGGGKRQTNIQIAPFPCPHSTEMECTLRGSGSRGDVSTTKNRLGQLETSI